jgi:hypothetical protein
VLVTHASLLLQFARVPVLVGLLLAAGTPQHELVRAFARLDVGAAWRPWLVLVVLAAGFVALALVGRRRRHPPGVLALEGLPAAVIGLIPPFLWIGWFGLGPFLVATGAATGSMFWHVLGVAWLVIVVMTAVRQVRASRELPGVEVTSREREG